MGKTVARGSRISIATQCLSDEDISKHIVKKVYRLIQAEVEELCSDRVDSTLKYCSRELLMTFKWSSIHDELQRHTPILLEVLLAATTTPRTRPNREAAAKKSQQRIPDKQHNSVHQIALTNL